MSRRMTERRLLFKRRLDGFATLNANGTAGFQTASNRGVNRSREFVPQGAAFAAVERG